MVRLFVLLFGLSLACVGPVRGDPVRDRIYPAPEAPLSTIGLPETAGLITVRTQDGLDLQGLAMRGQPERPVLLVFHGNASSARDAILWFSPAAEAGYGVVAAEYRGYSGNPGQPTESGLAADADAFWRYARSLAGDRPVWIVGHSLGGGVALALADRNPPEVLVTIGAFTRLRDMVGGLVRAVVPDAYRNIDRAGSISVPWFLIHGLADDVVPATHGQALHVAASETGRSGASLPIAGAGHRPDGQTVFRILEAIRNRTAGGAPSPADLPATVRIIPFGPSAPLPPGG